MHSFPLFILLLCLLSFHHVLSSYSLKNLVISLSLIFSLYLALPPSLRLSHTFLHAFAPSQSISLTLSALSFLLSPSVTHFHPNLYSWSLSCTPSSSFSFSLPPFYLSVSCSPTFSLYFYPHIIALFIPFYRLPPSPSHTCSLHTLFPSLFNPFLTISPSIFSLFCADVTLLLVHFSFSLSHPLYILFLLFPSLSFL